LRGHAILSIRPDLARAHQITPVRNANDSHADFILIIRLLRRVASRPERISLQVSADEPELHRRRTSSGGERESVAQTNNITAAFAGGFCIVARPEAVPVRIHANQKRTETGRRGSSGGAENGIPSAGYLRRFHLEIVPHRENIVAAEPFQITTDGKFGQKHEVWALIRVSETPGDHITAIRSGKQRTAKSIHAGVQQTIPAYEAVGKHLDKAQVIVAHVLSGPVADRKVYAVSFGAKTI